MAGDRSPRPLNPKVVIAGGRGGKSGLITATSAFRMMWAAAFLLVSQPVAARPHEARIALTFDDLPALTILNDQAYVDYLNLMILRGLKRHHFPATGFVNEGKLDELQRDRQIANLQRWLDAGMDLVNPHIFARIPQRARRGGLYSRHRSRRAGHHRPSSSVRPAALVPASLPRNRLSRVGEANDRRLGVCRTL
jgi:hypothetical protein